MGVKRRLRLAEDVCEQVIWRNFHSGEWGCRSCGRKAWGREEIPHHHSCLWAAWRAETDGQEVRG